MQPVIIDAIVVCFLVGFTLYGAHRGLFRAVVGLLAVAVALVGAGLFARTLAQPVSDLLAPVLEGKIEQRVDQAIAGQLLPETGTASQLSERVENLLELMGMDPESVSALTERAVAQLEETGMSLASAVVESLLYSILYGLLFILAFLALLVALRLLAGACDLVLKLPVLHGLNSLGGAAVGLVEAGLLLFLAIWAARRLGVSFETELVSATHVLRFFTANTPLSVLSFLL